MDLSLDTPVRFVPHIGPVMAGKLEHLNIHTIEDFLYHVPFRYDDFSLISPISNVQPTETVTIHATVHTFSSFITKTGKKMQQAVVRDQSGQLTVIWFNQPFLRNVMKPNASFAFSGTISWFANKKVLNSPKYEALDQSHTSSLHTGRLVPVYSETEGISSKWMRSRISFLLSTMEKKLIDFLPTSIRDTYKLMNLAPAISTAHFPESLDAVSAARQRIAFDEVFLLQLRSWRQKRAWERTKKAMPLPVKEKTLSRFLKQFPFQLTGDQEQSTKEILSDVSKQIPMDRLLVGDVGSGKTAVAAVAIFAAITNKRKAMLLAPTQILALQHYQTLTALLSKQKIHIDLVTSAHKSKYTDPQVRIGTHAILSDVLALSDVGLVIIDEQHKFGVEQREKLVIHNAHGLTPHLLIMTATPIPRTIAKTLLGTTNVSVLSHAPVGRLPVKTWLVPKEKRTSGYRWIDDQIAKTGGQVFVVCPLIDASESLVTVKAVTEEFESLKRRFPKRSVGLLHGRMKPKDKDSTLEAFRNKVFDILVTTPVVEVGIDIPNATIMVIEASDRFGLGQLHQLRGRVGRGDLQSFCLLFTEATDENAHKRLKALESVHNGPELAEIDLAIRGPGEVFGTRQHGMPNLKIASFTDMKTLADTKQALQTITDHDPDLIGFPLLREKA